MTDKPFLYEMVPASALSPGDVIYLEDEQVRIISIAVLPASSDEIDERAIRVMRLAPGMASVTFVVMAHRIFPVLRQYVPDTELMEILRPAVAAYAGEDADALTEPLARAAEHLLLQASMSLNGVLGLLTDDERYPRKNIAELVWGVLVSEITSRHLRRQADGPEHRG